jgi:hypothetical protein
LKQNTAAVRNRKPRYDKPLLAMFDVDTLDRLRNTADANALSMAAFVRQSVLRNLKAYENFEVRR